MSVQIWENFLEEEIAISQWEILSSCLLSRTARSPWNYFRTTSPWECGLGCLRRGWIMKPGTLSEPGNAYVIPGRIPYSFITFSLCYKWIFADTSRIHRDTFSTSNIHFHCHKYKDLQHNLIETTRTRYFKDHWILSSRCGE